MSTAFPVAPARLDDLIVDAWTRRLTSAARRGEVLVLSAVEHGNDVLGSDQAERSRIPTTSIREALINSQLSPDPFGVRVQGAWFDGQLDLTGTRLPCRLELVACAFDKPVILTDMSTAHTLRLVRCTMPSITARRVSVAGLLDLSGSHLTASDPNGISLFADGLTAERSFWLDINTELGKPASFTSSGTVRLLGATVGGQLNMSGAQLDGCGGDALTADRLYVQHSAFLAGVYDSDERLHPFVAHGAVRLVGAHIKGQLSLTGAHITATEGEAIVATGLTVDENLQLRAIRSRNGRESPCLVTGGIDLASACIGGRLDLRGVQMKTRGSSTAVAKALPADEGANSSPPPAMLDLTATRIGVLEMPDSDQRSGHNEVALPKVRCAEGWSVRDVQGVLRTDRAVASGWLDGADRFAAQPWWELARVYEASGQADDARWFRRQAAQRSAGNARHWWSRWIGHLYGLVAGYGYQPLYALWWILGGFMLAAIATVQGAEHFLPTTNPPRGFHPIVYAAETALPALSFFGQTAAYTTDNSMLILLLGSVKFAGWIMTAVLLAGVTSLLRKV